MTVSKNRSVLAMSLMAFMTLSASGCVSQKANDERLIKDLEQEIEAREDKAESEPAE